jgi:CYTH domain-containing protein
MGTKETPGEFEEIERKFLLPYLPHEITNGMINGEFDVEEIEQGYLPDRQGRIRKMTSRDGKISYFLTKKQKVPNTHGLSSFEDTKAIPEEEYLSLTGQIEGEVLLKTRYYVPIEGFILEINVFHGRLEGQVLGEVEFMNMDEALSFQKPEWVGREVTNEISNRMLAQGGDIPQE